MTKLLVTAIAVAGLSNAATTIARVSSTESVLIRGIAIPAQSVSSWAVSLNDEIATHDAPATIAFQDGSAVSVQRGSKVHLEGSRSRPSVRILSGSVVYEIKPQSHLQILDSAGKVLTRAEKQAESLSLTNLDTGAAAFPVYSRAAGNVGVAMSPSAISTGRFLPAANSDSISSSANTGARITLPNGTQFFVTVNADHSATINEIRVPVDVPNSASTFVEVKSGNLIGSTVHVDTTSSSSQPLTITSSSNVVLTPSQALQAFQKDTTTAVQSAIASGQLPSTAMPHPPGPVTTGTVSPGSPNNP